MIQFAPSDWVSLQKLLPRQLCCVCLMTLLKDFGTLPVVLLKDVHDADQYIQKNIPGGSDALLACPTHFSVCMKGDSHCYRVIDLVTKPMKWYDLPASHSHWRKLRQLAVQGVTSLCMISSLELPFTYLWAKSGETLGWNKTTTTTKKDCLCRAIFTLQF